MDTKTETCHTLNSTLLTAVYRHADRGAFRTSRNPEAFRITFAVPVELLLLAPQLVVELAVELHLQHLGEHQVAGGVVGVVGQQLGCRTDRQTRY